MDLRSFVSSFALCLGAAVALAGCTADDVEEPDAGILDVVENCPAMFAQDLLPEYHVEIAPAEWAALEDEFLHRLEREAAGLETDPYHPIEFRYGADGDPIPGVTLRLKGSSSWLQTIAFDEHPKMQFVIAFNEVNPDGRFLGVRKLELDMPRTDQTFLRQRLALYYLRTSGIPSQCANSARLVINGEYYGLYTNLERLDKEFLQRRFPGADDGDLWKGGRIIKTNEDTFSWDRIDRFWHLVTTADQLDELADLDPALDEWAAEAVIGDADGYYNGRANFFLYDHPTRGFLWLPHDLDTSLDRDFLPVDASPVTPISLNRWEGDWIHFQMVMEDPRWQDRYVAALAGALDRLDIDAMQTRVDRWSAQTASSGADDPHRPFTLAARELATTFTRGYLAERAAYLDSWLACRTGGGVDGDGDTFTSCFDCDDAAADVHPGAVELCNARDDDCDNRIDDVDAATTCP